MERASTSRHSDRSGSGYADFAARAFWLVLLIGHMPALLSAAGGVAADVQWGGILRLSLLLGTQALCLLKVLDVAWLRFPNTSAFWLRFVIIVALLHSGVIWDADFAMLQHSLSAAFNEAPLISFVALALAAVATIVARRFSIAGRHSRAAQRRLLDAAVVERMLASLRSRAGLMVAPDRAPPARA